MTSFLRAESDLEGIRYFVWDQPCSRLVFVLATRRADRDEAVPPDFVKSMRTNKAKRAEIAAYCRAQQRKIADAHADLKYVRELCGDLWP